MNQDEEQLRQAVKRAAGPDPVPPSFASIWSRAESNCASSNGHYAWLAGASAAAVLVVVGLKLWSPGPDEPTYIEIAELLNSTSWTAPSDVLMPEHQFDIYEDLPVLPTSTKPIEGALL